MISKNSSSKYFESYLQILPIQQYFIPLYPIFLSNCIHISVFRGSSLLGKEPHLWAERRSQWKDDAEGYVVTSPGALCGDSGAGEEESEQPVSLSSSIMAPIGLKAVVGESKTAIFIAIQCLLIRFNNCMTMTMRAMAELAVLEEAVGGGCVLCAVFFFFFFLPSCQDADVRPLHLG